MPLREPPAAVPAIGHSTSPHSPGRARRGEPIASAPVRPSDQVIAAERQRILSVYRRRTQAVDERYAPWQPAAALSYSGSRRHAAAMLHRADVFPTAGGACLEIGHGRIGWLGDLLSWGVRESDLHGIELDETRSTMAREILPAADLRVGDASELPWDDDRFELVVVSTVFTSILEDDMRRRVAQEITRVLAPGGAMLWYDFAVDNPRNDQVRGVERRELIELFPTLRGEIRSVTLAPPIARMVAPYSWLLATLLESIPGLRTHLLAVLLKRPM